MNKKLSTICVSPPTSLKQVLETIQSTVYKICLVTDEASKILGTITDGDCRRALLKGASLDTKAEEIMHRDCVVVDSSFSMEQINFLMRTTQLKQIPVVDAKNTVVDIVCEASVTQGTGENQPRKLPNAALILAGGKGTRLRPLTENIPKPMLPVGGRPMLERLIQQLVFHGITDLYISINYLGHIIENYFADGSAYGCKITYIREEKELGTAGPLRLMSDQINKPFLVVNGDLVTTVDFGAFLDFHAAHEFDLTVGVSHYKVQVPFGVIETNEQGQVTDIVEKPVQDFTINTGLYIVDPALISYIPPRELVPMTDFIETVIERGRSVGAFPIHESWADVGLPEQYQNVNASLQKQLEIERA